MNNRETPPASTGEVEEYMNLKHWLMRWGSFGSQEVETYPFSLTDVVTIMSEYAKESKETLPLMPFDVDEMVAIRKFINGEPYQTSTFIDEVTTTYGYGELDAHGSFQYPLPKELIERSLVTLTSSGESDSHARCHENLMEMSKACGEAEKRIAELERDVKDMREGLDLAHKDMWAAHDRVKELEAALAWLGNQDDFPVGYQWKIDEALAKKGQT